MKSLLTSSNLILFFSLPFKPVGKVNFFYNGHIAIALGATVYQIINPYLLKTDFLFSIMPVTSWLFGNGGRWVERNPESPNYTHVYLYKKSEHARTVVYGAGLTVEPEIIESIQNRFAAEDTRFRKGERRYNFLRENCSSIIAGALADAGLVRKHALNVIPASFFRRFVNIQQCKVTLRSISRFDRTRFTTHRICYGLWGLNPQLRMDRWASSFSNRSADVSPLQSSETTCRAEPCGPEKLTI